MSSRRLGRPLVGGQALAALAVLALVPLGVNAPSAAGASAVAASVSSPGTTLEAASADLSGLVIEPDPTADVPMLKVTSSSAAFKGLSLQVPCEAVEGSPAGITTDATTPADSTAAAQGGFVISATSFTAMPPNAAETTWTPADVSAPLDLGDVALTGVKVALGTMSAPTLELPALHLSTGFCTP